MIDDTSSFYVAIFCRLSTELRLLCASLRDKTAGYTITEDKTPPEECSIKVNVLFDSCVGSAV